MLASDAEEPMQDAQEPQRKQLDLKAHTPTSSACGSAGKRKQRQQEVARALPRLLQVTETLTYQSFSSQAMPSSAWADSQAPQTSTLVLGSLPAPH